MLFVGVFEQKGSSTTAELITRRVQWEPGEGTKVLGKYWLQINDPALPGIATIFETDDVAEILENFAAWDDAFDTPIVPAISVEEGLRMIQQRQG